MCYLLAVYYAWPILNLSNACIVTELFSHFYTFLSYFNCVFFRAGKDPVMYFLGHQNRVVETVHMKDMDRKDLNEMMTSRGFKLKN